MNPFIRLFCCVLLFSFNIAFAQSSNNTDTVIRVSFNTSANNKIKKPKKKSDEENIIKITPLGFVSGIVPVYYEKVINEFFTLQGGIGITSRNYIRSAFQEAGETAIKIDYPWIDDNQYLDEADAPITFTHRTAKIGYAISLEPRLYFDSEAPDGSYFGVSYDFYRYNFNIPAIISTTTGSYVHKGGLQKEHENISDLMAVFGYHSIYERLTLDFSLGLGLRNVKGSKYYYATDLYTSTNPPLEGFARYKQSIFNFNIGLKIGYHF